jgi:hypothetical protein
MNQRFFAGEASARQCDPNPTKPLTDVSRFGSENNEVGGWQQKLGAAARLSSGASLMMMRLITLTHCHHHCRRQRGWGVFRQQKNTVL